MHLLRTAIVCAALAMAGAQPLCDPETQWLLEPNTCCKKCGPGTAMSRDSSCLNPHCKECGENEYQDKYTIEPRCRLQPYCDSNKNFQQIPFENKKIRKICLCMSGFHCSSAACLICVKHMDCGPGYEAKSVGNQTHNTVCQECPKGTFSNENSWKSVCKKWTECKEGFHVKQMGTNTSDNICEKTWRQHLPLVLVFIAFFIVFMAVLIFCLCKGSTGRKLKDCVERCHEEPDERSSKNHILMMPPVDDTENDVSFPEQRSSQEEVGTRAPEENEDEPSEEMSAGVILTENGNYVTQEKGKTEILSRQESETQTF